MKNESLKQYEIAARIQEEAENRSIEGLIPVKEETEKQKPAQQNSINSRSMNEAIRGVLAQAILGEDYPVSIGGAYISSPDAAVPEKIKNSAALSRTIQDLLYKIKDSYNSYDQPDESIRKMMNDVNEKVIIACVKKLAEIWSEPVKVEPKPEEKKEEEPKPEEKKEEPATEVGDMVNQFMNMIQKQESISSPNGQKFMIESLVGDQALVMNMLTKKKYTIETSILTKWMNNRSK